MQWMAHWREGKSFRHVDYTARHLSANIFPSLGSRPIAEIGAPDVVAMVKAIQDRGAHDITKRAFETTAQIFRYAVAHGHAERNPATEIRPRDILQATHRINHARIDAKELPVLLRKIEVYSGTHVTRLAMKLMSLTFGYNFLKSFCPRVEGPVMSMVYPGRRSLASSTSRSCCHAPERVSGGVGTTCAERPTVALIEHARQKRTDRHLTENSSKTGTVQRIRPRRLQSSGRRWPRV
jgi:hypothetical protein